MNWSLDIGVSAIAKKGEELCGDVVEIRKGSDSIIVVMADGLGSGVKANIMGTLTGKIAARLLASGVDLDDVVRTIAETLPVCQGRQIAYSTFSIVQFYDNGQLYAAQFDNPPLLLIRGREILPLPGETKTVEGRRITETRMTLRENDILVMVSDGVTHAGIGALLPLGLGQEGLTKLLKTRINLGGLPRPLPNR